MKNVFKALDTNEKDNFLTAYSKGMVKGWGTSTMVIGTIASTLFVVGKYLLKDEKLDKIGEAGDE
jgi:hypothetical protein